MLSVVSWATEQRRVASQDLRATRCLLQGLNARGSKSVSWSAMSHGVPVVLLAAVYLSPAVQVLLLQCWDQSHSLEEEAELVLCLWGGMEDWVLSAIRTGTWWMAGWHVARWDTVACLLSAVDHTMDHPAPLLLSPTSIVKGQKVTCSPVTTEMTQVKVAISLL